MCLQQTGVNINETILRCAHDYLHNSIQDFQVLCRLMTLILKMDRVIDRWIDCVNYLLVFSGYGQQDQLILEKQFNPF